MHRSQALLWLSVSMALCACSLQATPNLIPAEKTGSGTGAPEEKSAINSKEILEKLDGEILNESGAVRFLQTGVLEIGEADANTTLTVFTEYHCAYCNEFHRDFVPRLQEDFVDNGALLIRFVPFEIKKYPNSADAIKGFICAGKMGKGLKMHTLLTERQNKHRSSAIAYAKELQIDEDTFSECLDSEEVQSLIDTQKAIADELDITLVPTFFLNSKKKIGLPYYPDMRGWIRQEL